MNIKRELIKFFDEPISLYSPDDSEIVGWSSKETQEIRFNVLTQIDKLDYSSVLDVGCGVGDLFPYMNERFVGIAYDGIDLHPKMIKLAKQKYPEATFKNIDLSQAKGKFDYILLSGALNLRVVDNYRYLSDQLNYMDRLAKKGIALNLLSSYTSADARYPSLFYYEPEQALKMCKNRYERVILRHDYLSNDFTLYIYK